jgi:hypothetical protein
VFYESTLLKRKKEDKKRAREAGERQRENR